MKIKREKTKKINKYFEKERKMVLNKSKFKLLKIKIILCEIYFNLSKYYIKSLKDLNYCEEENNLIYLWNELKI